MTDTPTLKEVAQELAQAAATEACMTGYIGKDRLDLWITDALTEAYERGQRDAVKAAQVLKKQWGLGGDKQPIGRQDRPWMDGYAKACDQIIASLPITPDSEKEGR